jgi:putative transposase
MTSTFDLQTGQCIWFEGGSWCVDEMLGEVVKLRGSDTTRLVSVGLLSGNAEPMEVEGTHLEEPVGRSKPSALGSVVLASLTAKQRTKALKTERIIRRTSDPNSGGTATVRFEAAARELGIEPRSVRRLAANYEKYGFEALVDKRLLRRLSPSVDTAWDKLCMEVLDEFTDASTPTRTLVLAKTNRAYQAQFPGRKPPIRSTAFERIEHLSEGRYSFGPSKQRRSVANRPTGVLGRLRATRPGEYVLMDTNSLDVNAMEPITLRWLNVDLTVAMDLYSRCIVGLCLRPRGARSADAAAVLYQAVTWQTWGYGLNAPEGPYVGVPESVVVGDTGVVPDTIIVDHGKIYMSSHLLGVCDRFGINVSPARTYRPTDKPVVEQWFKTLREEFLERLKGYKGPDIANRGKDAEKQAFYYIDELQQMIREWVGIYHSKPHAGLRDPKLPRIDLSPAEMFTRGVRQSGRLRLPSEENLKYEFLDVAWRPIHHYGVEMRRRRYDGPALNRYRGRQSTYGGTHAGKWPFMVDVDDVRYVHFRDPSDGVWHHLIWEHAAALHFPFSADAAEYVRQVSIQKNRHVDPEQAIEELLSDFAEGELTDRRARNLAIRISAQRAHEFSTHGAVGEPAEPGNGDARDTSSVPAVVDLLLNSRRSATAIMDDLDVADLDPFDEYYDTHPDGGLGTLDG